MEAGRERRGGRLVEWSVPGISTEASAMTFAFLRSMLRAPEIKFALFMPAVMVVVMGSIFLSRSGGRVEVLTPFLPSLAILWVLFGMVQLSSNHFGFDREGFRALVLLPARRRDVLLAKNLALLPMVSGMGLVLLGVMAVATGLEPWLVVAGASEMVAAFLAISLVGNVTSIACPYRIGSGTLKATKMPAQTKLWLFVMHLLFPLVMIPLMMPAGLQLLAGRLWGWPEPLVRLAADGVLLGVALGVYWVSLRGMGEWLQRREQGILQVVTQEVE
jgi:ABC-2 type transport system permease protein